MADLIPSEPYLWLGDLPIPAIMISNLAYSDGLKYAEQNLVGRKPTLQCTGQSLRKISSLQLHLDGSFCDIETMEDKLSKLAAEPSAYPMILECGKIIGDFVITSLKTNYRQTDLHGNPISAMYTLSLSEYVKPKA
jgi:phage protein U